jgi:hypothetical protein
MNSPMKTTLMKSLQSLACSVSPVPSQVLLGMTTRLRDATKIIPQSQFPKDSRPLTMFLRNWEKNFFKGGLCYSKVVRVFLSLYE